MIERVVDPDPVELPIFELPLVLLPGEQVPLHIFEERYKRMVGHCLDSSNPFGLIFRDDEGTRSVGCSAAIEEVLERFSDGRLNILIRGREPFRVLQRHEAGEYPAASVVGLDPAPPGESDDRGARSAFGELLAAIGSDEDPPGAGLGAFELASRVELPVTVKQALLEEPSEGLRLTLLERALSELAAQMRRSTRIAEIARGNGHAPGAGP
jgi:hypothetical protein